MFTYENETIKKRLETYEWDNVWWEKATTENAARVLYIGDSISCGTRGAANRIADGKWLFDGFGTSKAVDNPYLKESVRLFANQQGDRKIVIINNGLHGWHLSEEEYEKYYSDFIGFLVEEFKETPIAIVLTTSVKNEERDKRVEKRNEAAIRIAEKFHLPVIDLFKTSKEYVTLRTDDGVHYNEEGYGKFADVIIEEIEKICK